MDNEKWAVGFFRPSIYPECVIDEWCITEACDWEFAYKGKLWHYCTVDPTTVGQCTGLCDKNGKLVFEGDIIELDKNRHRKRFKVVWGTCEFTITPFFHMFSWYEKDSRNLEVIGNVYDNINLLEGE